MPIFLHKLSRLIDVVAGTNSLFPSIVSLRKPRKGIRSWAFSPLSAFLLISSSASLELPFTSSLLHYTTPYPTWSDLPTPQWCGHVELWGRRQAGKWDGRLEVSNVDEGWVGLNDFNDEQISLAETVGTNYTKVYL
ncbi:9698_t:CDS:2 [Paraglomus occultum]|uniref:9698_t:CDS:1 n=1 Tax=Paraglomus occultum TaxID=144539 RepID=A0A9N9C9R9_9GLOM|nr:9698_t:CDS:2 [Paraglomus occultum]